MKSLKVPFNFSGGKTSTTTSLTTIAEQKIISVLVTNKFERVMLHRYGSSIRQLMFEPNDPLALADFLIEAKQDVREYVSRADILDIRVSEIDQSIAYANPETTLGVNVIYKLPSGSPQLVKFKVVVPSQLTEDTPI